MSTPRLERTEEPACTEIDLPAGQFPGGNARRRTATAADGQHAALVADACRLIEAADTLPDLSTLAQHAGLSPSHFHRIFKAQTGLTPKAYASAHRANRLRHALGEARSVTDAIYDAGFNANSRFYEKADRLLGMRARDYRAGGDGVTIRFAVAQCSLGAILVAQSERGICAILMDDDPAVLVKDLQDRFPKAHLIGGDADFEQLVARVIGFVEAPAIGLDLPLDLRGTAFQERVWQALRKIPVGTTLSYAAIAARKTAGALPATTDEKAPTRPANTRNRRSANNRPTARSKQPSNDAFASLPRKKFPPRQEPDTEVAMPKDRSERRGY